MKLLNVKTTSLLFSLLFMTFGCRNDRDNDVSPNNATQSSNISESLSASTRLNNVELLGRKIFFDTQLSQPAGQSCSSCHTRAHAFSDSREFSEGAVLGRFGDRHSPSVSYSVFAPPLHTVADEDESTLTYVGGFFWNGRANTLEKQAEQPFFNPLEMNNRTKTEVVDKIRRGDYADLFKRVFGNRAFSDPDAAFDNVLKAIASYEKSSEVNPFSSKFDAYLRGDAELTSQEKRGLKLFNDPLKGNCAACHPSTADSQFSTHPLFTDYTYDNLGLPKNQHNTHPEIDFGLGGFLNITAEKGKHKVPTLRNVEITAPYFHNAVFKTLEEVVEFYNSRDKGRFGTPEYPTTMNREELGELGLKKQEVKDIVAFLKTLTDGYDH